MTDFYRDDRVRLRAHYEAYSDLTGFLLEIKRGSERLVVKPITFETAVNGALIEPTFSMPKDIATDFLRSVMDVAWEMGVRPTGYDNDLGATKHHLDDMRKIVFHKLGMKS